MTHLRFGGIWTQEKLNILEAYLDAYTTALKNQPFTLAYVDAFAGAGSYTESKDDYGEFREFRDGSARIALEVNDRPFDRLVFIEKETEAARTLLQLANKYQGRRIDVVQGDANVRVPEFCRNMGHLDRAVIFLDPFATQVSWETIVAIAKTERIDCWILFPLMAVSRMMPTDREPEGPLAEELDRVFGGREHWMLAYGPSAQLSLLGEEPRQERGPINRIASLYRERLGTVFRGIAPASRTLTNSKNTPLFELFFAAGNPRGARIAIQIADHILKRL